MPAYLRPTAPIAAAAILPDDPAWALALAQRLLERPRMANHSFGLWGYSGRTPSGEELTIQSTGIGGPSAAMVTRELAGHGARHLVRIGRCRALGPQPPPGTAILVAEAIALDGASRALGAGARLGPDGELSDALRRALRAAGGGREAPVASTDVGLAHAAAARGSGAAVADLATAATLALGAAGRGLRCAALLCVEEAEGAAPLEPEALTARALELGDVAAAALADLPRTEPLLKLQG